MHGLVDWLQGASKACHTKFFAAVREREERAAAEKREVGGAWSKKCVGGGGIRVAHAVYSRMKIDPESENVG